MAATTPLAMSFMVVSTAVLVLAALLIALLGALWPGDGRDILDWRPTRTPEAAATDELDDMAQMLAATNHGRRRRGLPELTEDELTMRVVRDQRELRRMRERTTDDDR